MKKEAAIRSDSCATSLAALEVRNAWPRVSIEASSRNGGRRTPPLCAREGARCAGVQDGEAQVGGGLVDERAQLVVGDPFAAEQESLLVGVARVVDEQLATDAGRLLGAQQRSMAAKPSEARRRLASATNTRSPGATPPRLSSTRAIACASLAA